MIRTILFLLACAGLALPAAAQQLCPVIPLPDRYEQSGGHFLLNNETAIIVTDPSLETSAHILQQQLLKYADVRVTIQPKAVGTSIVLKRNRNNNPEAYTLDMNSRSVTISASGDAGIFYGITSLMQLASTRKEAAGVPCWNIQDAPLYKWRGFMLDESRQFFGKEDVKKILDQMAFYKLNRFHWHLTDDPGWRIEIKQYPRLTVVGGIGNVHDSMATAKYYTQEEIAEIVSYAAERHITVVPEIDMPGHARGANRAYPQFSGGGSARFPDFTFNPGKEETYQYLTNILREVDVLFPSQMIHIGGDEVSFGSEAWNKDAAVQQLMRQQKLGSLLDVEHYFVKRMADSVIKLNNQLLGWDEVTASALPAEKTIVFWWRHEKLEQLTSAIDKGYRVVLCPRLPFYLDFVQDSSSLKGRRWKGGGFNSVKSVYDFSLQHLPASVQQSKLVEGLQANLWSETIVSSQRMYYLAFPRLIAFAEAAWTKPAKKDYAAFEKRLAAFLPGLRKEGIYYYNVQDPTKTPEVVE